MQNMWDERIWTKTNRIITGFGRKNMSIQLQRRRVSSGPANEYQLLKKGVAYTTIDTSRIF